VGGSWIAMGLLLADNGVWIGSGSGESSMVAWCQ